MRNVFGFCCRLFYLTICWAIIALAIALACLNLALRGLLIYEQDLTRWVGEALGVSVEAEIETTRWLGFRPEIYLSEVIVGEGDSAIRVSEVVVEPNLVRSLLTLSPSWEYLQLSDVDVVLEENYEGGWQIAGIDLVSRRGNQGTGLEKMLLSSSNISLENVRLRAKFSSGAEIEMHLDRAQIENGLGFHRMVADARLSDEANQLQLIVELTGVSNRFSGLGGLAYVKLDGTDLTEPLTSLINRYTDTPIEFDNQPSVSGEIWANVASGLQVEFQGRVEVSNMPGQIVSNELENLYFRSDVAGYLHYFEKEVAFDLIQPDFSTSNQEWPLDDFRLTRRHSDGESTYSLQMQSVDLDAATDRVSLLYALPEKASTIVADLSPSGLLEDIEVSLQSSDPLDTLSVYANLRNVDVGHFNRAPAVRSLSGYLAANAFSGSVQVDSENLSLKYQTLYDHWLDHGSAQGDIGWRLHVEQKKIAVFGKDLVAETQDGLVHGAFLIDASTVPSEEGMDLYLDLGIQGAHAENWPKFLPKAVPQSLNTWLSNADLSGEVTEGAVIYRGKVRKELVALRSYQVRLKAKDAQAVYLESWPKVTGADADVLISNRNLYISAPSANMPGIQMDDIAVTVDTTPGGLLNLTGAGSGETNTLLDLVRQTGMRNSVGDSLDQLQFEGLSHLDLELSLPLKRELVVDDVDIDLDIDLKGNRLTLTEQNLTFSDLSGSLRYDDKGLSGEQLEATLWSESLTFSLLEERGLGIVNIAANGLVSMDSISEWLNLDFTRFLSGTTQVNSLLQIATRRDGEQNSRYLILSDLFGVESHLPGTLSKSVEEKTEFQFLLETSDKQEFSLDWSNGLKLELEKPNDGSLPRGVFDSAVLSLNRALPAHESGKFAGSVSLGEVNVDEWIQLVSAESGRGSASGKILGLSPDFSFMTEHMIYGGKDYSAVELGFSGIDNGWRCSFKSSFLDGSYIHTQDADVVPNVILNELNLDKYLEVISVSLPDQDDAEQSSQLDPRTIPAMDLTIESLVFQESNKGTWSADLRPSANGLNIENLKCSYFSLSCGLDGESSLYWERLEQGDSSALALSLEYEDVTDVFDLAGIEAPVTSETGTFYASIAWDESPQKILESPLSGVLGVELYDGEFKADPESVSAGILRLIGLVNIDTWFRRLKLDFSDVAADGTAYDELGGDFTINNNVMETLTPVYVDMPSGRILLDGAVDLDQSQVEAQLVVTLPARQNMAWVAALTGGLPAAVGVWVVGKIFDDELDSLASVSYRVSGPLANPEIKTERVFDATVQQ